MSGAFDRLPAAIVGKLGELAAGALMKSDGASVIALCRIDTGGAPVLETGTVRGRTVLPDFQVFNWSGHRGACFVEIKTYAEARENRIETKRRGYTVMIHGIPVRLFNEYCENEKRTGLPVFLAINELDTGEMRVSSVPISQLERIPCFCKGGCRSVDARSHVHQGGGIREMQWYFDRDDFSTVYRHSDKTIEKLRDEHARLLRPGKPSHALNRHVLNAPSPEPMQKRLRVCGPIGYTRKESSHRDAAVVIGVEPSLLKQFGIAVGDQVTCHMGDTKFPGVVKSPMHVSVERSLPTSVSVTLSKAVGSGGR